MIAMPAPIALFVYNRPAHARRTIEALASNQLASESDLFIYSDAPKDASAAEAVKEIRRDLNLVGGFRSISVVEREKNYGLANSIIDGVTTLCERHGTVIVLEDDLLTAPNFLVYMNGALERYRGNPAVYSVSAYSHLHDVDGVDSTYFLKLTSSWGWATWADKWKAFERDKTALARAIESRAFRNKFNFGDSYDYAGLARSQLAGKSDSWAIYWHFCVLQRDGLTLYPAKSLVNNIGFDGSGVHKDASGERNPLIAFTPSLTAEVSESMRMKKLVERVLRNINPRPSLLKRAIESASRRLK